MQRLKRSRVWDELDTLSISENDLRSRLNFSSLMHLPLHSSFSISNSVFGRLFLGVVFFVFLFSGLASCMCREGETRGKRSWKGAREWARWGEKRLSPWTTIWTRMVDTVIIIIVTTSPFIILSGIAVALLLWLTRST